LVAGPALVVALVSTLAAGSAQAAPADAGPAHAPSQAVERRPAVADFEGHSIDLSGDWGQARACLVWRQGGVMECFRNAQALAARENGLASRHSAQGSAGMATTMSAYSYSCSSSLSLYDYGGYGGRELDFWDRGFWQNLGDYGFDNATSSYIVGGCYAHLADGSDGGGWWYPGATSPYHGEPYMYSSWNDRVSSIYIE
jgi:hypothetical protein